MNRSFIKDSNFILRKIFHNDKCLEIIKDFIQTFLEIQIKSIKVNQNTDIHELKSREYGIVDVRITTKENIELNVGIQIIDGDYIQSKMLLYYAKIHSNQIFYEDKRKIAKTITINILDFNFFAGENFEKKIKIKSNVINDSIIETIELLVIELPKFIKLTRNRLSAKETWIMYLEGRSDKDIELAKKLNPCINKLDNYIKKFWEEEKI